MRICSLSRRRSIYDLSWDLESYPRDPARSGEWHSIAGEQKRRIGPVTHYGDGSKNEW